MAEIDRDAIAARAYALYVRGGRRPSRAQDDWLEAERQLRSEHTGSSSSLAVIAPVAKTLVPGAPVPASKLAVVTPPPSAPAVPAAHVEAAKATASKLVPAPKVAAAPAPKAAAAPAPAPSKGSGNAGGGGPSGKKNRHKRR